MVHALKAQLIDPIFTLQREQLGHSLTGITSGVVKKRPERASGKTCGLFAKDWPEWLTVESAFDVELTWVCVKEATFVASLSSLYPKTNFLIWEPDLGLPPVNFIFCSQWLPPLTNKVWKCERLEVIFAAVEKLRFTQVGDWKSVPISIKHSEVGGCSDSTRIIRAYVRRPAWLDDMKVVRKAPRMVSSFCKDHHIGRAVAKESSRRILTPLVHSEAPGVYHGDGLYPANLIKQPQFLLRSCRAPTGWCKRKLETSEVLSLYDISETVALVLTPKLRSQVIGTKGLTPMKILLSAAVAVIKEFPGGGYSGAKGQDESGGAARGETLWRSDRRSGTTRFERLPFVSAGGRGHQR
jgi:hypothetical protein